MYISSKSKNADAAAKFLDYLSSKSVQQAHLGEFGATSVNKTVTYSNVQPLDETWHKIFNTQGSTFVNGDQAFPLDVTTEYWRIINDVASDKLPAAQAAADLQKFIGNRK
jgi:raffinose/stachyose/melibiose transport system substrate-binding protein